MQDDNVPVRSLVSNDPANPARPRDVFPGSWRRGAIVWAVFATALSTAVSLWIHGRDPFLTVLVLSAGLLTVPGLAFARMIVRRAPEEHKHYWWTWLYGLRCFFIFGYLMLNVGLPDWTLHGGAVLLSHLWLLRLLSIVDGVGVVVVWSFVIRETIRSDVQSKEHAALSGEPRTSSRIKSELAIDVSMALIVLSGPVIICLGPRAWHLLVDAAPVLEILSAVFGIAAGLFWGATGISMIVVKSGHRALSVDVLDAAMAVVALSAPLLLLFGPDILRQTSRLWLTFPLLGLALVLPAITGAVLMVYARIERYERRVISMFMALMAVSTVDAWLQIIEVLHGWRLPAAPFIFMGCVNWAVIMLVPLFETTRAPRGLDRLSPQAQLRKWNGIPVVTAVGVAWLVVTMEHVRHTDANGDIFTVGALIVMVSLATARHFFTVDETRGLYVELERSADELLKLSRSDPLTGLDNRRALFDSFEQLIARCRRTRESLTVVMIDLDLFKQYNDQFGHLAGDTVLRRVAAVLADEKREQDVAARFGGEEFCLLLPATDIAGALNLMRKISAGCAVRIGRHEGITFSAGVALWDRAETPDALMQRADDALYRAKDGGRDQVVVAERDRVEAFPGQ